MKWIKPVADRRSRSRDFHLGLEDDEAVARDGETVRVRLLMCDSIPRSGYRLLDDEQVAARREARSAWIKQQTDAWRGPNQKDARGEPDDDDDEDADARDRRRRKASDGCDPRAIADARRGATAAYRRMVTRLGDAWRRPVGDFAEPSIHSRPEELMRRHLGGDPTDPDRAGSVEAELEITRAQRKRDPPRSVSTGPGAEAAVERRRQAQQADFRRKLENAWRRP
jgi:hypothetical protein